MAMPSVALPAPVGRPRLSYLDDMLFTRRLRRVGRYLRHGETTSLHRWRVTQLDSASDFGSNPRLDGTYTKIAPGPKSNPFGTV